MSRHTALAAFFATVAVAVPAGWHALDADIQTDGKRVRPLQQSFTVDGAKVTLDVDRGIVMTGGTVTAKLVAYSDTPKQVTVDLTVFQSSNYEGERVEQPQIAIDHEKLVLAAAPGGGKPVATSIVLGKRPDRLAMNDSFRIYVAPHGKKVPTESDTEANRPDTRTDVEAGTAAAVSIEGWSGDSLGIDIKPEGRVTADEPFVVAVRIKNTSGRRLPHAPSITLGTGTNADGYIESSENFVIEQILVDGDDDGYSRGLGRGKTFIRRFMVMPNHPSGGRVTFVARATAWDEAPGPVIAGALDARTFSIVPSVPAAVAAK